MKLTRGIKIDVGAGNPAEGENQADSSYILQDVHEHEGIGIVCDLRNLQAYLEMYSEEKVSDICSEIRASHILEHFHATELKKSILPMLKACLMDGGILNIIVPNFAWHCRLVLDGEDEQGVYYAFGRGNDEFDIHFTGWTPKLAYQWLNEAGFEIVDFKVDTCIHIKAKK